MTLEISKLTGVLLSGRGFYSFGSASEKAIEEFERTSGVKLPGVFRCFISKFGQFVVNGIEFVGIDGSATGGDLGRIFTALKSTKEFISRNMLPIAELGDGSFFTISKDDGDDGPVYLLTPWNSEDKFEKVADSFSVFLEETINNVD